MKNGIRMFLPRLGKEGERNAWLLLGAVPTAKGSHLIVNVPFGAHDFSADFQVQIALLKIRAIYDGMVTIQRIVAGKIACNERIG